MKKFLITCAVLLKIAFAAQSQTSKTDTICIPVSDAQKIYAAAEQKKILHERVELLSADVANLWTLYRGSELQVQKFKSIDSINTVIIRTKDEQLILRQGQIAIREKQVVELNKEVKKWQRRTRFTTIAGIAAVLGTIFILK